MLTLYITVLRLGSLVEDHFIRNLAKILYEMDKGITTAHDELCSG